MSHVFICRSHEKSIAFLPTDFTLHPHTCTLAFDEITIYNAADAAFYCVLDHVYHEFHLSGDTIRYMQMALLVNCIQPCPDIS